ncbi:MAG: hypothetical protein JSS16_03995 [Proteobacteria bacterium]|nr:hypothetical protein [Pseudomonadota bacterium]
MAVLLVLVNLSAWGMPAVPVRGMDASHVSASAVMHHHCDEAAAAADTGAKQSAHGKGCPCCVGGACVCLHSCSPALIAISFDLAPAPPAQLPIPVGSAFLDAAGERRLRPPIA